MKARIFKEAKEYKKTTFYGFYHPVDETPDGKEIDVTKDQNKE